MQLRMARLSKTGLRDLSQASSPESMQMTNTLLYQSNIVHL
jgi:hypothetical protein